MAEPVVLTAQEQVAISTVLPRNEWEYDPERFKVEVVQVVERILASCMADAWDEGFCHARFEHDCDLIGEPEDNPYRSDHG